MPQHEVFNTGALTGAPCSLSRGTYVGLLQYSRRAVVLSGEDRVGREGQACSDHRSNNHVA